MPVRVRLLYSGRVQGVGFRYTTSQVAARHAVTGYVRNLADGRVELVAEGEPGEIDRLAAAVAERMAGHVDGVDRQPSAATGEFAGFGIRR